MTVLSGGAQHTPMSFMGIPVETVSPSVSLSRRSLLRGRLRSVVPGLRPPWAPGEADFLARCTRCGECMPACPTVVIVPGDGGYPVVDFSRGECTFCGACADRCAPSALLRSATRVPWALKAAVGETCLAHRGVECRVCGECCEQSAIRFRPRLGGVALPELDAAACNGCGACVAPCPVRAIAMENEG